MFLINNFIIFKNNEYNYIFLYLYFYKFFKVNIDYKFKILKNFSNLYNLSFIKKTNFKNIYLINNFRFNKFRIKTKYLININYLFIKIYLIKFYNKIYYKILNFIIKLSITYYNKFRSSKLFFKNFKLFNYKFNNVSHYTGNYCEEELEIRAKNNYKKKYFIFFNKFLINFLQFLFKLRIHISFKKLWYKIDFLENLYNYDFIVFTIKKHSKKLKQIKFIQTFLKILLLSMKIKDSKFFVRWLIYRAELMFYKLHKYIPYLLNIIFKYFSKIFFQKTHSLGIFFSLRGKISLSGDSKKKNVFVKYGKHSSSQKNLNLNLSIDQIKTATGVLGVTFGIFF